MVGYPFRFISHTEMHMVTKEGLFSSRLSHTPSVSHNVNYIYGLAQSFDHWSLCVKCKGLTKKWIIKLISFFSDKISLFFWNNSAGKNSLYLTNICKQILICLEPWCQLHNVHYKTLQLSSLQN